MKSGPDTNHAEILQGGHDLESSSSSEHAAAAGSDDEQLPIRDGVRMDGQWEYQ